MDIGILHDATSYVASHIYSVDVTQLFHGHLPPELAQINRMLEDNLFSNMQKAFNTFVKTGQVWAFILGLALGYIFRSFTSFG
jgi:uncharacterized membrane protein required for colicin V production